MGSGPQVSSGGGGIFCAWDIGSFTDRADYDRAAGAPFTAAPFTY